MMTRRGFVRSAAGVAGASGAVSATAAFGSCGQRIPRDGIGMHLYTMRGPLAVDYPGTLRRLADIGYRTVGVSGRFGHSAAAIRGFADDAELEIVLEHVG